MRVRIRKLLNAAQGLYTRIEARLEAELIERESSLQAEIDRRVSDRLREILQDTRIRIEDHRPFYRERREKVRDALTRCRTGDINAAQILYEGTIDKDKNAGMPELMVPPEEIGSTPEEVETFWLLLGLSNASTWLKECREGDFTNAYSLGSLCRRHPEFLGLMGISVQDLQMYVRRYTEDRIRRM